MLKGYFSRRKGYNSDLVDKDFDAQNIENNGFLGKVFGQQISSPETEDKFKAPSLRTKLALQRTLGYVLFFTRYLLVNLQVRFLLLIRVVIFLVYLCPIFAEVVDKK